MSERPLSVLLGRDREALEILIPLHCSAPEPVILDCTHNKGVMWKGCKYKPSTTMDIDPQYGTDIVGDFRNIPVPDGSYDIIVFDPPHLPPNAASDNSSKIWEQRYGITADRPKVDHVSDYFPPFLAEAHRVLRPDGLVLAKIADLVHNHRYQWQHLDFLNAVFAREGLTACDMLIKRDRSAGSLKSSKWTNVRHLRKCHCYWIVVRRSNKCERAKNPLYSGPKATYNGEHENTEF